MLPHVDQLEFLANPVAAIILSMFTDSNRMNGGDDDGMENADLGKMLLFKVTPFDTILFHAYIHGFAIFSLHLTPKNISNTNPYLWMIIW